MQDGEVVLGIRKATVGGGGEAARGSSEILRAPGPFRQHHSHIVHGLDVALTGCALIPATGLGRVLRHAHALFEHGAEAVLRRGKALLGGAGDPVGGLIVILRQAAGAGRIALADFILRGRIAIGGRFAEGLAGGRRCPRLQRRYIDVLARGDCLGPVDRFPGDGLLGGARHIGGRGRLRVGHHIRQLARRGAFRRGRGLGHIRRVRCGCIRPIGAVGTVRGGGSVR